jgi:hypothetical protein
MAHGDAREEKWRGNWRMAWVASTLHTTSEHGVSSITNADAHTSAASSRLNWNPHRFKWTRPFCRKTKSGFCACAITFQTQSTSNRPLLLPSASFLIILSLILKQSAILKVSLTFWHRSFTFNSNKLATWCNNFSVYYPDVCLQLNMLRALSRPSLGAQWLQWHPLVLPSYRGVSCAVFVVELAGPTTDTARLSPRYKGKTRGCYCSHWAPDDGRENDRNMLSCKQTSG